MYFVETENKKADRKMSKFFFRIIQSEKNLQKTENKKRKEKIEENK